MASHSSFARRGTPLSFLVLALPLLIAAVASSASGQAVRRPTIALVLGGGSARGIAHVGVLRWMEEHRIPIDYVIGTSMGGLIAGAYATGMSPKELDHLVNGIDWDELFLGEAPYSLKTIRRKEDSRLFPSHLRFGLRRGVQLPGSLDPGQAIDMLLQRLTLPYYDLKRFDDLPTPFRTVAVDVRTSDVVVLTDGPLWRALRSTMAIPGVFAPVHTGERVFVDGGVLDNLPTDVARSLEADVVIAVSVGSDPEERVREPAQTYLGAAKQATDLMGVATLARSLALADIVINPKLEGLGSLDWRRGDALTQRGYEAAEAQSAQLQRLALDPQSYAAFQHAREARRRVKTPVVDAIEIGGITNPERTHAQPYLDRLLHHPIDPYVLAKELTRLTGSDRYQTASAAFVKRGDSLVLRIDVMARSNAPPFLFTALDLQSAGQAEVIANFRTRFLAYDKPFHGSELRVDFGLGVGLLAGAEWYQPIGLSKWFGALTPRYALWNERVFRDGSAVAQYQIKRADIGGDIGFVPTRNSELRAGYLLGHLTARRSVGEPTLPTANGFESAVRARALYDGMDSPMVPSHGLRVRLETRHYFHTADLQQGNLTLPSETPTLGELTLGAVRSLNSRDRLFVTAGGGTRFGTNTQPPYDFLVGGLFRLTAYYPAELRAFDYAIGSLGYLRKVGRLPDFVGGGVYLGAWVEGGALWRDDGSYDNKGDLAIGALSETFFGPAMIGGAISGDGTGRLFLSLTPLFR